MHSRHFEIEPSVHFSEEPTRELQVADDDRVKAEFRTRHQLQIAIGVTAVAAVLFARTTSPAAMPIDPGLVAFLVILGALALSVFNWRCPACEGYLGRGMSPRHCPGCGVALRD